MIFLPSIPMGIAAGLFTRVATFHFLLCIFVCVNVCLCVVCMCELCEGLAPPWWFIAAGSGPICFRSVSCSVLASLQRSPGPPDAESGWDPSKTAWSQHHKHTLCLTLSFPHFLASLYFFPLFNFTNSPKHPPSKTHSDTHTYSLSLSLLFCPALAVSLAVMRLLAISWHQLQALSHMQTCKHRHAHTHTLADNRTHSHGLHSLPLPSPHHHSILCSQLMSCWLTPFILCDTFRMCRPAIFTCLNSN